MTRAVRDRRWRHRVLLVGVVLLAASGVLLLQGSRPQASLPRDPLDEEPPRRPGASYPIPGAASAGQLAGSDEDPELEGEELRLTLVDGVSGAPVAKAEVELRLTEDGAASPILTSDEEGVVSLRLSDEQKLELESKRYLLLDAEAYDDRPLSAAEVDGLLETGSGTFRLQPLAKLVARMVDASGAPITEFGVCLVQEDDDSSCEYSSEGTVKIDNIRLGERQLWATASAAEDDAEQGDRIAVETARFDPGEEKSLTFRVSSRLRYTASVSLVDGAGEPIGNHLVEVELEPREPLKTPIERAIFASAQDPRTSHNRITWRLRQGGWYNVKVTPRIGPDRPIAQAQLFVGETERTTTVTISERPVRCVLVSELGLPVPVTSYRVTVQTAEGSDSFGGGGALDELRFFWPGEASEVEVLLRGVGRRRGTLTLHSREDRCEVKLPATD